jgi:MraZ protein
MDSAMFLGQHERSLDDKGRIAIPVELRNGLGPGAILTRSFDNCLCIYPAAKWESLARAIDDLPHVRPDVRDLARSLFGSAVPCDCDRQGRVVIPAFLREHAGLTGEAIVVGVHSRVEIWDRDAWLQCQERFERDGARLAEALTIPAM